MLEPYRTLALVVLCATAWSCSTERERVPGQGAHPDGWGAIMSSAFHGQWLRDNGYPLAECRVCHGADYAGGPVDIGCQNASCHTQGVESCGTCHGSSTSPLPGTGAHASHSGFCTACHPVPQAVESGVHLSGMIDVQFAGLATAQGQAPSWDAGTQTCANTYCHGSASPPWTDTSPLGCDACHNAPPDSHVRFARVADTCADCHGQVPGPDHINGSTETTASECTLCHGQSGQGAPGPALDGSLDPAASVGVGAHQRHLDRTLPDRIGRHVACTTCHPVPAAITDSGHIDTTAPADIDLPLGGTYDPQSATCTVWCHWDRDPGPVWTDASGAARQCDSCHGFPPLRTREGTAHPTAPPDVSVCLQCHPFDSTTHVDGEVNVP